MRSGLPGAVGVAAGGDFYWEGAAGLADVRTGEPLTPAHRFRVQSVMKIFVATVVLQLVDEGLLELDGDAAPIAPGVTVRQLLNHTSGLPNYHDDMVELFEPYRKDPAYRWPLAPREVLALALDRPRLFPPGEGWAYTGTNYLAAGLLVEEATGATLRQELRRRIVEPLGLDATDLPPDASVTDGLARGYFPPDNPLLPGTDWVDVTELDLPFNWRGGGVVSNGRDLARFLEALLGGELLPSGLREAMLRAVPSNWEETDDYGLGIGRVSSLMGKERSPCGDAWGHLGLGPYMAIALVSEDGQHRAVVLANGPVMSDEGWIPLGRLTWACYCR